MCLAQTTNIAPLLTATGNQAYCAKSQINIVTDFNIVDPDDTKTEALYVQISTGYSNGEDTLILTGSHPTITTSWNALEGKLTLSSITTSLVSYTDFIAAVKAIVFQSSSNNPTNKEFSITVGDANYLPSTDHYYQYVPSLGITWSSAKTAAESSTYFGLQGYLATITSVEEAQLCGEQAAGAGWIGGSDAETEGTWKWVTGPEAGTVFWNGDNNGSTTTYSNWNINQPDNAHGGVGEDYLHITDPSIGIKGAWNDLRVAGDSPGVYHPKGYIVEYGGMPGDPILNIATSTSIYTASIINTKPASVCASGIMTLEATASAGASVLWYDAPTGGTLLTTNTVFTTPNLTTTTTYYALASLNGCTTGFRTPVFATVHQIPSITSVTNTVVCETGSGTLSATASAGLINWYSSPIGGVSLATGTSFNTPVLNTTTTYYVDATNNGCTTLTRTPITVTVQKTPLPTANTTQRFCDIENPTISNLVATGSAILWYASNTGGMPLNSSEALVSNTIYYASQTINTCESVSRVAVTVIIDETVVLPQSQDIPVLYECDTMLDGSDTNGYTNFNLTSNETILLNGKLASNYNFSYFIDSAYTIPITTPSNAFLNTIQGGQTIYVRIANNLNNLCYTDASFEIKVNELPVVQTAIIFKNCDEDGTPDGFTNFNLEEVNNVLSNNNSSNLSFTYYLTYNDANLGNNEIASIFNNQIANTIFVRVENGNTCYRVATVNLQVSTTSFTSGYFEELTMCDDDAIIDGKNVFNLTSVSPHLLANFPLGQNLSVHYFETLNDALLEQNEIINQTSYTNKKPFSQVIYVRVESEDNGDCFGVGPHLKLTVNPRPEFEVDNTAIYCLDNNPIRLTTFNPKGNYTYQWKDEAGLLVSSLPYAEVISGGRYSVIATSTFGCESFPVVFNVVESAIANINLDDITIVELSDNNSITINNENNNLGIGDYEFSLDAVDGPYQDEPFFSKVGAGSHIIYVKDKNLCGIAQLEVFILGFPKYFTPNNDGFNDIWQVKGLGNNFSNTSTVKVFDRYGKLIKQLNAKNGTWDGTFNGQPLTNSDYWFIAELVEVSGNVVTYKGHFSLVR
ncbi:T9SS type B sorting domain-containing protein [Mariniflexile jejuense]|uniref:T9SS type B sorting domain-containing protein n=1 Tax=Mariniflexile jejuense TaxID=1173582 RepID=A0ABW3JLS4_9FLAO